MLLHPQNWKISNLWVLFLRRTKKFLQSDYVSSSDISNCEMLIKFKVVQVNHNSWQISTAAKVPITRRDNQNPMLSYLMGDSSRNLRMPLQIKVTFHHENHYDASTNNSHAKKFIETKIGRDNEEDDAKVWTFKWVAHRNDILTFWRISFLVLSGFIQLTPRAPSKNTHSSMYLVIKIVFFKQSPKMEQPF